MSKTPATIGKYANIWLGVGLTVFSTVLSRRWNRKLGWFILGLMAIANGIAVYGRRSR